MPARLANRPRRPRAPGELLQVGPDNPAAGNGALRQANRLMEEQDYDRAEVILRRLVAENTRDPEPLASLAICVAAGRKRSRIVQKTAGKGDDLGTPDRVVAAATRGAPVLGYRVRPVERIVQAAPPRICGIQQWSGSHDAAVAADLPAAFWHRRAAG